MSPLESMRRMPTCMLGLGLLGWLAWVKARGLVELTAGLASRSGLWEEAFELPLEQRLARTLAPWDLRIGMPQGYLEEIVASLLAHVGPQETVQVVGVRDKKHAQGLVPIPHLVFPRRLEPAPLDLQDDPARLAAGPVLSFRTERQEAWRQARRLVASGPDWTLWR